MHELGCRSLVFRGHRAGEVESGPGNVRVNIHTAREYDHAHRVDGSAAFDGGHDSTVGDANVANFAVDVMSRVVDFAAGDSQHGFPVPRADMRSLTSSLVRRSSPVSTVASSPRLPGCVE